MIFRCLATGLPRSLAANQVNQFALGAGIAVDVFRRQDGRIISDGANTAGRRELLGFAIGGATVRPSGPTSCASWLAGACLMLERGLNGFDTILRIRSILDGVPSLVVTGDTTPDRIRDLQASGIALLHKPVGSAELRRAIATMVEASALVAAD